MTNVCVCAHYERVSKGSPITHVYGYFMLLRTSLYHPYLLLLLLLLFLLLLFLSNPSRGKTVGICACPCCSFPPRWAMSLWQEQKAGVKSGLQTSLLFPNLSTCPLIKQPAREDEQLATQSCTPTDRAGIGSRARGFLLSVLTTRLFSYYFYYYHYY